MSFKNKISFVGDGFTPNEDDKLHLVNIQKERLPVQNEYTSVIFIECTEMVCNKIDANLLCISILIEDMGLYLGVMGSLQNEECHIYIFIG